MASRARFEWYIISSHIAPLVMPINQAPYLCCRDLIVCESMGLLCSAHVDGSLIMRILPATDQRDFTVPLESSNITTLTSKIATIKVCLGLKARSITFASLPRLHGHSADHATLMGSCIGCTVCRAWHMSRSGSSLPAC